MTILYTSIKEIKSFNPCISGLKDVMKYTQSKGIEVDQMFPLKDCLESNSFKDICWLLGKRKKEISICAQAAQMCADSVKHLNNRLADAADAAAYADDDAAAAYSAQRIKNKQFLLQAIIDYEQIN